MTQDSPTETSERALLFVMMDMPAEHDEEFNRWYAEEHLPERANLPGFRTARRFKAVAGEPPYLATYDLDSLAALETPEYKALVSPPGEWTRRIGRLLNANIRNVYTEQTPAHLPAGGHPDTAALLAVMLNVAPEHDAEVIDWYDNEHLPERLACPGFLSARRFSAVAGTNPRHLALYELTSTGALETPEYKQVSGNPTEATQRVLSLRQEGGGAMCMSGSPDPGLTPQGQALDAGLQRRSLPSVTIITLACGVASAHEPAKGSAAGSRDDVALVSPGEQRRDQCAAALPSVSSSASMYACTGMSPTGSYISALLARSAGVAD